MSTPGDGPATRSGRVVRCSRARALVQLGEALRLCALRRAALRQAGVENLAAGDEVLVEASRPDAAAVSALRPRRTVFGRIRGRGRPDQVVAANADLLLGILAVAEPAFRPRLADRFHVVARRGGLEFQIVLTKVDLEHDAAALDAWRRIYEGIGVRVHAVSTRTGAGLPELRRTLQGRLSVLCGQSGVGKTSLLNALVPGLDRRTQSVSETWGKGQHTTSLAELIPVDPATALIDTPGMRSFSLAGLGPDELLAGFPDLADLARDCRFRSCTHVHEPGCEVAAAVDRGALPSLRLEAWRRLLADDGRE
jgi:ribosome biogenesis GTPase